MNIERISISDLLEDPANARKHDAKNLRAIKGSLKRFGQQKPLVVDAKGIVIAGNGTLAAARELGWDTIDVVRTTLAGAEAIAYAIADNRAGELAGWDDDVLGKALAALDADGWDLPDMGWDDGDWTKPGAAAGTDGLTDPDEVPDEVPARSKRGDVWLLGEHRVMCGDSTSAEDVARLMRGEKADMVFTDPPYGVGYEGGVEHKDGEYDKERWKRRKLAGDDSPAIYTDVLPVIARATDGPIYVWFAGKKAHELYAAVHALGLRIHAIVVWVKRGGYANVFAQYKQKHEPCLYLSVKDTRWKGPTDECTVWDIQKDGVNEFHPTQKPVALAERAISNHDAQTVLDLFLGSGSTLIACEKTGRRCFGMEVDPHYVDVIVERWERFTGRKAVLSDDSGSRAD